MITKETEERYNEICVAAYLRLNRLTKGTSFVDLTGIDVEQKSHRMVVSIAKAYAGITSKKVRLDMKNSDLKLVNSVLDKDCRYLRLPMGARKKAIKISEIIEAMEEVSTKLTPDNPDTLDAIYDEFFGGAQ